MFSELERQSFSLTKAVLALADGRFSRTLEGQLLEQHGEAIGKLPSPSGFVVPWSLLSRTPGPSEDMRHLENAQKRALTVGNDGGNLVPDRFVPAMDTIRGHSALTDLGATILNSRASVSLPDVTSASSAHWLTDENSPIPDSRPVIKTHRATPKTCGSIATYTKLFSLATVEGEHLLEQNLLKTVAQAVDEIAISGSGSNGEPLGLANVTDAQDVSIGGDLATGVLNAIEASEDTGARPNGVIVNPQMAKSLRSTPRLSGGTVPLLCDSRVHGLSTKISHTAPTALYTGEWQDATIVLFGSGPMVAIDPFTDWERANISLRVLVHVDVVFRRQSSFVRLT